MRMLTIISVITLAGTAAMAQEPSSETSSAAALFEAGMNYLTGVGVNTDVQQGVDQIRRAAERGYAPAQTGMGYFLQTGTYVAGNAGDAANWYEKSANQGDTIAEWALSSLYYKGNGVNHDLLKAEEWARKAADASDPFGEYLLGLVLLERNYHDAPPWFLKAAEQGLPQAQRKLGLLYKEGRGVPKDNFQAYVWLLVAFDAGEHTVALQLSSLEGDLGTTLVNRAKTKAREIEKSYSRSTTAHGCTGWDGEFNSVPTPPPPKVQALCRYTPGPQLTP